MCVSAQSWPSSVNRSPLPHGYCHFLQALEISWLNVYMLGWVAFESRSNESKMEGICGMHFFPAFTTWFQTWRSKGEYHCSQSWTWQSHQFFAPVHALALQSAFASFNKHRSSLWKHTVDVLFLFHFPVNRKRAMAGFSLRWEDPNLMILRNTDLICGSGVIFC